MQFAVLTGLIGGLVGLVGGGIAFFNSYMGVRWKRAELANSYIKDFNANPELVFAGRCLDWNGGKLALPDALQAYMPNGEKVIAHDKSAYYRSISPSLRVGELDDDPRCQIYRTSLDTFLSWLALVASAIDRKIFVINDIEEVAYWVSKIESEPPVMLFIKAFGYETGFDRLRKQCRSGRSSYKNWHFLPWLS
jgi:hypothetical protein